MVSDKQPFRVRALLATPRPRQAPMVARSDADRVAASSESVAVHAPVPYNGAASRDNLGTISTASRRLRALAALSGSLTDPLTAEEAADLVEQQALAVLGAS